MNSAIRQIVYWIFRLVLGGIFIYAGTIKLGGLNEFSDAIMGFSILPKPAINIAALTFPILEIVLGSMIIIPSKKSLRIGALGLVLLNLLFLGVLSSAWFRGLNVECSCFGFHSATPLKWELPLALIRDLIFLAASVYFWESAIEVRRGGDFRSLSIHDTYERIHYEDQPAELSALRYGTEENHD